MLCQQLSAQLSAAVSDLKVEIRSLEEEMLRQRLDPESGAAVSVLYPEA